MPPTNKAELRERLTALETKYDVLVSQNAVSRWRWSVMNMSATSLSTCPSIYSYASITPRWSSALLR